MPIIRLISPDAQSESDWLSPDSAKFLGAIRRHCQDANPAEWALRNGGYIRIEIDDASDIWITLRPSTSSRKNLDNIAQWLNHGPDRRHGRFVNIRNYDADTEVGRITDEAYRTIPAAADRLIAFADGQHEEIDRGAWTVERLAFRPIEDGEDRWLGPIYRNWLETKRRAENEMMIDVWKLGLRVMAYEIETETAKRLVLKPNLDLIRAMSGADASHRAGETDQQIRWLTNFCHDVALTGNPRYEHIISTRDESHCVVETRFRRLILPWTTATGRKAVIAFHRLRSKIAYPRQEYVTV